MSGSRIYQYKKTVTLVAGEASFNTIDIRGMMRSLMISPATSTTKWRVTFTNDDSVVVYKKGTVRGSLVDHRPISLFGVYTVAILGGTVDEVVKFTLNYEELQ